MRPPFKPGTVLLVNVGNRELTRDGQPVSPPRSEGQKILDHLGEEKARLSLPIIGPTIAFLQRARGRVDRVVLFATDQSPDVAPAHRMSDTINFAKIIEKLLEEGSSYPNLEVDIRTLKDVDPSLYDACYAFYQEELGKPRVTGGFEWVYVLASGGTPAMNLGLLFAAIERFGQRCIPLYLQQGASVPRRLILGQQLRLSTLRRVTASHLDHYQFAAAAEVLDQAELPHLQNLAEYAAARLNFDWERAWTLAGNARLTAPQKYRRTFDRLQTEAAALADRQDRSLFLGERFHRARVAYETGAYSEFLALLVALEEVVLQEIIRRELAIDFTSDATAERERRAELVRTNAELSAFLDARQAPNGGKLDFTISNRVAMLAFLDYLILDPSSNPAAPVSDQSRRAELAEARQILIRLDAGPASARNRSVHGDGGASKRSVDESYNPAGQPRRDLLSDLERISRCAGGRTSDWALDLVRSMAIQELEE